MQPNTHTFPPYLFMISINIILLYTLNLPNTFFPSGFNISGATDYPHTRPKGHIHVTRTPKCISFRSDAKNTAYTTIGSVEHPSFCFSVLCVSDCRSIPRSPAPRAQQLFTLCSRHANDTIAFIRTATRQSGDKNSPTVL